jgi:DNA-binding SARP family transcriptional activator
VLPVQRLSGVGRRVLAYLAIKGSVAHRSLMCMDLWPDLDEPRARANLRRALWQLPTGWVSASAWDLRLDAEVDLAAAQEVASVAMSAQPLDREQVELLTRDLLPGWYDAWLAVEQDLFHLQRIQALEAACRTATNAYAYGLATSAGLAAVCAEPLRESAVTALIEAHLGEGNLFEAVRRYHAYAGLLRRELDTDPGAEITALVSPFTDTGAESDACAPRPRRYG